MKGLEELTVEMGFIPCDLVESIRARQDAEFHGLLNSLRGDDRRDASFPQGAARVSLGDLEVLLGLHDAEGDRGDFVAGNAAFTPEERGDLLGEFGLKVAFGLKALDDAVAVVAPALEGLEAGDDGGVGAEAVLGGVELDGVLGAGRLGTGA